MKIIHIVLGKANPLMANGVNVVVDSFANWCVSSCIDCSVYGITKSLNTSTPKRVYDLELFKYSILPFVIPKNMKKALSSLPKNSVVHFHGALVPVYYGIAHYLNAIGIPYIVTPHSSLTTVALQRRALRKYLYIKLFEKKFLENAYCVHALADSECSDLRKISDKCKIVVVPNGISHNKNCRFENLKKSHILKLGYIGRIEKKQKGLDILLDGFKLFLNTENNAKLYVVGDGPDKEWFFNSVLNMGLEKHVEMLGALYGDKLDVFRYSVDLTLHTSRWEGIAMTVLESLSRGIPVVVSKETNMGEMVDRYKAGWQLDANTPESLAKTLINIANIYQCGDKFEIVKINAVKLADENFHWNVIGPRIIMEVYSNAVKY